MWFIKYYIMKGTSVLPSWRDLRQVRETTHESDGGYDSRYVTDGPGIRNLEYKDHDGSVLNAAVLLTPLRGSSVDVSRL